MDQNPWRPRERNHLDVRPRRVWQDRHRPEHRGGMRAGGPPRRRLLLRAPRPRAGHGRALRGDARVSALQIHAGDRGPAVDRGGEGPVRVLPRALSTQMRVLVVEPLRAVPLRSPTRLAVVDGVVECGPDDQAHAELLRVLGAAVGELRGVPIVFLIASRPEYEIRTAFNRNPFSALTKSLVLDDQYAPDKDIKVYFDSIIRKIRQEHISLSRAPWPAEHDVDLLVSKASGQFVFAATVIKFIDSPRYDPANRLEIILGIVSAGNETPFALLDALYCFILGSVADLERVLQVLALLLLAGPGGRRLGLEKADELLGFDIRTAVVHSLLFVPPPAEDALPRICHASLYDFLRDRARARVLCE
jgi:hypothetical protein